MGLGRKIFTLGAMAAGAVVGVLFAPGKGKKTRDELNKKWKKGESGVDILQKTATKMGEDIAQTAKEAYHSDTVKKGIETAKQTGKEVYGKAASKAKNLKEKIKNELEEVDEMDDSPSE